MSEAEEEESRDLEGALYVLQGAPQGHPSEWRMRTLRAAEEDWKVKARTPCRRKPSRKALLSLALHDPDGSLGPGDPSQHQRLIYAVSKQREGVARMLRSGGDSIR